MFLNSTVDLTAGGDEEGDWDPEEDWNTEDDWDEEDWNEVEARLLGECGGRDLVLCITADAPCDSRQPQVVSVELGGGEQKKRISCISLVEKQFRLSQYNPLGFFFRCSVCFTTCKEGSCRKRWAIPM